MLGLEGGKKVLYTYNLLDEYKDNTISMARTTGYTCTAVANLVLNKKYTNAGISPPEFLGDHYSFINKYLKERDVIYKSTRKILDS